MIRRPPRSTRTDTLFPYTTLFRSQLPKKQFNISATQTINLPSGELQINAGYSYVGSQHFFASRAADAQPDAIKEQYAAENRLGRIPGRSEEHTSELQSLMRISYAVFCLKKKHTSRTHIMDYT